MLAAVDEVLDEIGAGGPAAAAGAEQGRPARRRAPPRARLPASPTPCRCRRETGEGLDGLQRDDRGALPPHARADGAARALRRGRQPVRAARAGRRAGARGHRRGRAHPRAGARRRGAALRALRGRTATRRRRREPAATRASPRAPCRRRAPTTATPATTSTPPSPPRSRPGERASVGTGIAVAIPPGHAGLVLPRSGLAARHGIALVNAPGLIDSGYRGELRVLLLQHRLARPIRGRAGRPHRPAGDRRQWRPRARRDPEHWTETLARRPAASARPAAEIGPLHAGRSDSARPSMPTPEALNAGPTGARGDRRGRAETIDIASAAHASITGLNDAVGSCETPVIVDLTEVGLHGLDRPGAAARTRDRRLSRRGKGFAVVCADGRRAPRLHDHRHGRRAPGPGHARRKRCRRLSRPPATKFPRPRRPAARRAERVRRVLERSSSGSSSTSERQLDQPVGEPDVLRQQRPVQVGADHVAAAHALEAVLAVVAVAARARGPSGCSPSPR